MPKEYSVDDILAEVLGDRATRKPASKPIGTVPKTPAEVPAAGVARRPFRPESGLALPLRPAVRRKRRRLRLPDQAHA